MLAVSGVPDLTVHDHLCFVYDRDAEVRQALVEYALAGLARWEQVCVFTEPGAPSAAVLEDLHLVGLPVDDLVDCGLLVVESAASACLAEGVFDAGERLDRCAAAVRSAVEHGHTGLRVYVETHFLLKCPGALSAWPAYELHTDLLVKQLPLTAMCGYDARRWPARSLMLAEPLHTRRSRSHSAFRLHAGRDGTLRLSGEVDFRTAAQVDRLLCQTAPSRPTAVLDVSGVWFIDVSGARTLGTFCEAIADEHGPTTLRGATPLLRKIWKQAGWSDYFPHAILED